MCIVQSLVEAGAGIVYHLQFVSQDWYLIDKLYQSLQVQTSAIDCIHQSSNIFIVIWSDFHSSNDSTVAKLELGVATSNLWQALKWVTNLVLAEGCHSVWSIFDKEISNYVN